MAFYWEDFMRIWSTVYRKRLIRYASDLYIAEKRNNFERMKTTDFFKDWKKAQYECQKHQCAYCRCHIDLYSPDTQVDHIKPICHFGANEYDNLVLACKKCNYELKKGNYRWYDANGGYHKGWNRPSWIEDNPVLLRVKQSKNNKNMANINNRTLGFDNIPF